MNKLLCTFLFVLAAGASAQPSTPETPVRGSGPFETLLDGAHYPEYGTILLRCDAGTCSMLKTTFLCDRTNADFSQSGVTADRVRVTQVPTAALPELKLEVDDFGTQYSCKFDLMQRPNSNVLHVKSYSCSYLSSWRGNKRKTERSVEQLDLKRACKSIVLKNSAY